MKVKTYNFKHWDLVQLHGFLGRAPVGSIVGLQRKTGQIIIMIFYSTEFKNALNSIQGPMTEQNVILTFSKAKAYLL